MTTDANGKICQIVVIRIAGSASDALSSQFSAPGREAQSAQHAVEDAVLGVEHPREDQRHRDRRRRPGDRHHRARDSRGPEGTIEQQRRDEAQADRQHDAGDRVDRGDQKNLVEVGGADRSP